MNQNTSAYFAFHHILSQATTFYGKLFAYETFRSTTALLPTTIDAFVVQSNDSIDHPLYGTLYFKELKEFRFEPVGSYTLHQFTTEFLDSLRHYCTEVSAVTMRLALVKSQALEALTNSFSFLHVQLKRLDPAFQTQVLDWLKVHKPHVHLVRLDGLLNHVAFSTPEQLEQPTLVYGDELDLPAKGHFLSRFSAAWVKPSNPMLTRGRIKLMRAISEPSFAEGECETVLNWMFPALPVESE